MKTKIINNYYFKFILSALVVFCGCYLLCTDTGVWKSLPLVVFCGMVCGFIDLPFAVQAAFFAVFSLVYSSVFMPDTASILLSTGVSVAAGVGGMFCIRLFRKKNAVSIVCSVLVLAVALGVHMYFHSNIVSALVSRSAIDDYITETYAKPEFSSYTVSFDYTARRFAATLSLPSDPTNDSVKVSCKDGRIKDGFITYTKSLLMKEKINVLTDTLRSAYPKGRFKVCGKDIDGYPYTTASLNTAVENEDVSYYVYLTREYSADSFRADAIAYADILTQNGFDYDSITFIGGRKGVVYLQVTLEPCLIRGENAGVLEKFDYIGFFLESTIYDYES
ncbi:MAG TPA: hypothetical protein PLT66_03460 [Bacillota bacterium]|nr:hypothetical protein [Bacillota bacterium]